MPTADATGDTEPSDASRTVADCDCDAVTSKETDVTGM